MGILSLITDLATTVLNKVFPDKTEADKQRFILELQASLAASDLMKAQIDVNTAEAANPNRKWVTWRECLGYVLVAAISWQWLGVPFICFFAAMLNHPIDIKILPNIEILDVLYLLCGMVGIDASGIIAAKVKGRK